MSITADQLVVAVSSRALFDLEKEHQLFEKEGYEAFKDYQVEHCDDPLQPGVAFPFVKRLIEIECLFPRSRTISRCSAFPQLPCDCKALF